MWENEIIRETSLLQDLSGSIPSEHKNDFLEQKAEPGNEKRSKTLRCNLRRLSRNIRQVECTRERVHCGPRKMILRDQY